MIHELPGHVTRPSAFQTAANGTFKRRGHASVAPVQMQSEDDEAFLDAICKHMTQIQRVAFNRQSQAKENLLIVFMISFFYLEIAVL